MMGQKTWCISVALTYRYTLDNLRFGKIDVSRYPQVAEKFGIDTSTWSKQLPTVILFQEGKEKIRRPVSTKKTTLKFIFTKEHVIRDLELNEIYGQCKKHPLPRRKDRELKEAVDESKKDK
nr:hypothetical protein BaRGS_002978 [Batillaria attramentaria]